MARFDENTNSNKNQPTHKVVIETEFGNLTVSLFTKNNVFHAELVEACEGNALHFIRNSMTSAVISQITDNVTTNGNSISAIKAANKAA